MNDIDSTTVKTENISNRKYLADKWKNIDWKTAEHEVNRLQIRIVKAVKQDNWNKVKRLQYLITHSYSAKLLAVRNVTINKGKNTPGIDKVVWRADSDKMKAALSLTDKCYKSKPLRRIYIEKKNKKSKRPLSIPCLYDRAMQALYVIALQPIAETLADKHSYGFRKYRSCQDACEHIFTILSRTYSPQWILEGDIKGCFDNISHQWLIDNIPMDKSVLKQFLKSGFVYKGELFPTIDGTPQGGIISPILANMALDGIQKKLAEKFDLSRTGRISEKVHKKNKVNFVRYADDFIVTAISKDVAEEVKELIKDFLDKRGLRLSEEKTLITNINDGFDLLGWNFRKYNGKLIIKPSKRSIKALTESLTDVILRKGKAMSQDALICKLNQKLIGWGNYHKSVCSKTTFQKIDHILFILLWKWACHRHNRKNKKWIKEKYWHSNGHRDWIFSTNYRELKSLSYVPIIRHTKLNLSMNPYLDQQYFAKRKVIIKKPVIVC